MALMVRTWPSPSLTLSFFLNAALFALVAGMETPAEARQVPLFQSLLVKLLS